MSAVLLRRNRPGHGCSGWHFGMHRRTVRRFVRADSFPERARPKRKPSALDQHRSYLEQRWREGCHNAARLWRELRQQGFRGCESIVRKHLAHYSGPDYCTPPENPINGATKSTICHSPKLRQSPI